MLGAIQSGFGPEVVVMAVQDLGSGLLKALSLLHRPTPMKGFSQGLSFLL